jgi:hypothetical protein
MANEFKIRKGLIVHGSGSVLLSVSGSLGSLLSITDITSGSLFSIRNSSGNSVLDVSSDDSVKLGTFGAEAIKVSGSNAIITGSLFGTASYALSSPGGVGATPGGSDGQLQYNNDGVFAGTDNLFITGGLLALTSSIDPGAPPSSSMVLYAKSLAGRMMPKFKGPSGTDSAIQPALFGNSTIMWLPGTGATLSINFGTSFTARNSGAGAAQSHVALASTSDIGGLTRANFNTGTTATGVSGIQTSSTVAFLGNSAGRGGFFFSARFGVQTISDTWAAAIGLSALNAVPSAEPSLTDDSIWLGKDAADTNWQVITRSTTLTKTDTGIAATAGQVLDLYIFSAPNSQAVTFYIKNALTGADLYTGAPITGATLPANTTFMYMQTHIRSASGATSKVLALSKMYLEKDL